MNRDTTVRLLFIAVLVFGLLACVCACAARRAETTEFPKLTE